MTYHCKQLFHIGQHQFIVQDFRQDLLARLFHLLAYTTRRRQVLHWLEPRARDAKLDLKLALTVTGIT